MIRKLFQNLVAKVGIGSWLLGQDNLTVFLFYLLVLFLPTQLGKHFFPQFSFVQGLRVDYLSPTIYITDILILLIFVLSFKKFLTTLFLEESRKLLLFCVFLLTLCLGISVSKNPLAGLVGIIKFLEYSYLFVFIIEYKQKISKNILGYLFGFGICFESGLALMQFAHQGSFQGILYFLGERSYNGLTPGIANASINGNLVLRPYATFPHPNVLAGYLTFGLILFLYFGKTLSRYFKYFVMLLVVIGVFMSLSRTGIVFLGVFLFIYFGTTIVEKYKKRKINSQEIFFIPLVTLVSVTFLNVLSPNNLFLKRIIKLSLADESIVIREKLMEQSFTQFMTHPVFGVGVNNFINNLQVNFGSPSLLQPVHNIFLLVLSDTGIIGLGAVLILLILIIKRIKNMFTLSLILGIIILGSFDHYLLTIQQGQLMLVLIFSIVLSSKN